MRLTLRYSTPDIHYRDRRYECDGGIKIRRLTYFGHVARVSTERLPLYGRIDGSRPRRRPRKKWLDSVKKIVRAMNLNLVEVTRLVEDRRCRREFTVGLLARKDFVILAEVLNKVSKRNE